MAKLAIGFSGGTGSANPSTLSIQENETISVTVTDDCRACFDDEKIFKHKKHRKGSSTWVPKRNQTGTAWYDVLPYGDCSKDVPVLGTHSIKVGSRVNKARKTKSARAGKARKSKPK